MPIAFWRNDYNTGNALIDSQHQRLFDTVNRLYDAMQEGHGQDILSEILDEMAAYTKEHFRDEEDLMLKHNYPHYEDHKLKHQSLIQELNVLRHKFHTPDLTKEVSRFLTGWLIHHIKDEDKQYIAFFKEPNNSQNLTNRQTAI